MDSRKKKIYPILVGAVVGCATAIFFLSGAMNTWSSLATDRFFLKSKAHDSVVIVAIDDSSIAQIGRWPWPRSIHAEIISELKKAEATAIGYDVNFPESSDEEDDTALEQAIKNAGNVVLPVELTFSQTDGGYAFDKRDSVSPIAKISAAARSTGFANTPPDSDGVVRSIPLIATALDGSEIYAFANQMMSITNPDRKISDAPTDWMYRLNINYNGPPKVTFQTVSAVDVIRKKVNPELFRGKAVFVGATAADLHDDRLVPTSLGVPMPGVEIHASLYDTLLTKRWLIPLPSSIVAALMVILGIFVGLCVSLLRARFSFPIALVLWIGIIIASGLFFERGRILDVVWPTITVLFAFIGVTLERRIMADRERRELKTAFSRYVSPDVVDEIIKNPSMLKLGGEKRHMTVLFSDVRGFTTISESLPPEQLVEIMNTYLTAMTEIVFANGGTLDKYIGDAVMAFWNAPLDQSNHAIRAARTAFEMQKKLSEMNQNKIFPNGIELKMGVGINTGEMIVGNMGSETRFDYTVLGDSVNLCARLESLTKEYGVGIIISEATRAEIGEAVVTRELGEATVKGKKTQVLIHELLEIKK
jgi:adenylate cyclase